MKSSPEGMDVSMKRVPLCVNLLTVLCTDAAISTGRDPRAHGRLEGTGNSGKYVQLVSANFKAHENRLLPEVLEALSISLACS